MNEKIPESQMNKLIYDDGRRLTFKIKIDNFPFLLKRKLESMASNSGKTLENVILMMLDNEVKSVEKILGVAKIE